MSTAHSIVIPTHDRSATLQRTLDRLRQSEGIRSWEVVVVANACSDDTTAQVASLSCTWPGLRLIELGEPSASVARNLGASEARGELVVFLDDDILVESDALATIEHWYKGSDGRSLLVGQVLPLPEHLATPFGAFRQRSLGGPVSASSSTDVDWYSSQLAAVPAATLADLGGYDESYPAASLEDNDLAVRARRAGYRIVFHPGLQGTHNDVAGTTARDFCRRAAFHCASAPLLAERFPDNDHPFGPLIEVNRPAVASDPLSTRLRKGSKGVAVSARADRWLPAVADSLPLPQKPREVLYRASVSLAMFGGYQRGLRRLVESRGERLRRRPPRVIRP